MASGVIMLKKTEWCNCEIDNILFCWRLFSIPWLCANGSDEGFAYVKTDSLTDLV